MKTKLLLLILVGCLLSSCSGHSELSARLAGRGPLPLSTSNPYIASNLLLAEKAGSSDVVKGFIQYRGLPTAIEVENPLLNPTVISFYYPTSAEYYTIEEAKEKDIIAGPFVIEAEKLSIINTATQRFSGTPVLLEGAALGTKKPAYTMQPATQTAPVIDPIEKIKSLQSVPNLPQAEITPQGDLVHYVGYEGETLSMITRWYTHDIGNLSRIIRINTLKNPDKLNLGDAIVIPQYLIKCKSALTEEAVQALAVR